MYFDARAAKLLAPGGYLIVDGCPGLRLVAAPDWKSWTYRYKNDDGKMRQVRIGRWPSMGAAEAAGRWRDLRDGRAGGVDPVQARRVVSSQLVASAVATYTVGQLLRHYLREVLAQSRSPASFLAATRSVDRLIAEAPELAACQAGSVTRAQAFDVLQARAAHPTATQKLRSLLGAAWDHALDAGRIDGATPNWWRQLMRGRLKSKGKIIGGEHQGRAHAVLSLADVGQVMRWGQQHLPARGFDVLVMYLWTAMRGVEILRLEHHHFEETDGVLWATLPKALTKNARVERALDLRVPILGQARVVVERRLAVPDEIMWPNELGEPYTQKAISTLVYHWMPDCPRASQRGGLGWPVSGWSAHRLRATARTLLASLGCPKEVGDAIIGHVPLENEGTYNRYSYDAEKLHWLGVLSVALESAVGLPRRP